ncbi:prolipoprotein diacylglyceryl transferase [bacterium]|nr:prolipoprotein diacylglyceryl transferase [bacterium]
MQELLISAMHWTGRVKPIAFSIGIFTVRWYGIFITTAMLIGLIISIKRCKKLKITSDDMLTLFLIAIPLAVIGARLGFVISRFEYYFTSPYDWQAFVDTIAVWDGGLTIMVGVPFGVLGGFIWAKAKKINFVDLANIVMPTVLLSQALGRWGNFFNQELYGQMITNPSLQWFPMAVFIADEGAFFQATFFYEMVLNIIGFFVLSYLVKHINIRSIGIFGYIAWYYLVRGSLEFIRDDGTSSLDGAVNANIVYCYVAAAVAIIAIITLIIIKKKKGKQIFYKKEIPLPDYVANK